MASATPVHSHAMDRDELAFAGVARQAELIRSGDVTSRELVLLYLERIERLDPQLNSFRNVMAERALVDAQQADGRRGAGDDRPLLGVPLGGEGRRGRGRRGDHVGHGGQFHARLAGQRAGAAPARRGRRGDRQDQLSRARDHWRHRGTGLRNHAQPLEPRPQPGRLEWRQCRRRGGRPLRRRNCLGWRGLDPHPGVELRPGRVEADARLHPARTPEGALVRHERRGLRGAQRRGRRAADEHRRGRRRPARFLRAVARAAARGGLDKGGPAGARPRRRQAGPGRNRRASALTRP